MRFLSKNFYNVPQLCCSQNPKPVEKKKDYYIPLIKKVNWRVPKHQQSSQDNTKSEEELTLDQEAAAAIMKG